MNTKLAGIVKSILSGMIFVLLITSADAQNAGIGTLTPVNKLDIQSTSRIGVHPTVRPLYVTGNIGANANGIEFRRSNGTEGIGFGFNTVYAAGFINDQKLSFASKGTGRLLFYTNDIQRVVIDAQGRMTITADVNGPQIFKDSYPLRIQGSNQGIAITLDGPTANAKNFVTFWDESPGNPAPARGRIEGQTYQETTQSFEFIWTTVLGALDVAAPTAEAIACGFNPIPDVAEVATNTAAATLAAFALTNYVITTLFTYGVSYESAGADYAEWIEKKEVNEIFSFGDVVGVKDGKISKTTTGADHLMVISMAPIILGNMPEKPKVKDYEKVAFMGQIPVKVSGSVSKGDYILASGLNDGFAFSVNPEKMNMEDYNKMIGVAWSAAESNSGINYVKVAVGINNKSLAGIIKKRKQENSEIDEQLTAITTYLKQKDPGFNIKTTGTADAVKVTAVNLNLQQLPSEALSKHAVEFINKVEANPALLTDALKVTRMNLENMGVDLEKTPRLKKLLTDERYFMEMYKKRFRDFHE